MTQEHSVCETFSSKVTVTLSSSNLHYFLHYIHILRNKIFVLKNHITIFSITLYYYLHYHIPSNFHNLRHQSVSIGRTRLNGRDNTREINIAMILIKICIKTTMESFSTHHFAICDTNNMEVISKKLLHQHS